MKLNRRKFNNFFISSSLFSLYPNLLRSNNLGNKVLIFTARGSSTGIDWRDLTEYQLNLWGVNYTELILGKPEADIFIDDKAHNAENWFSEFN